MTLGPLQVHAHQHLDPVLSLHPTLADRDGHHGAVVRVGVGEKQVELSRAQLASELGLFFGNLLRELGIARRQVVELDQITRAFFELVPCPHQLSMFGRFARQGAGTARVVPGAGLR